MRPPVGVPVRRSGISTIRTARGFNLIELMIAVGVVAILAIVAIPSYSAYVIRGKRAEAKTALLQGAQYLERNYSQAGCYSFTDAPSCANGAPTGTGVAVTAAVTSAAPDYAITPTIITTAQTYVLTATPVTFTDADCGALTLDNTGAKGAALTTNNTQTTANATGAVLAAIQQCWQR